MSVPVEPTANDCAQAVAEARRLFKRGTPYSRIELIALAALLEAFPAATRSSVMQLVGIDEVWDPAEELKLISKERWWREDLVNEIVGVLVAPYYGAQAK